MCIRKTRLGGRESCQQEFVNGTLNGSCSPVWDNFLCWPPTPPGQLSFLSCPRIKGNDVSKFAFRKCLENGTWTQRPGSEGDNPNGWTNYSLCFNPYIKTLMKKVQGTQSNLSKNEYLMKHNIAERTRILETGGLTLSFVALLISLLIFYKFRNLQNNRTQIHKNLFIAMLIQIAVRLTVYIDQYLAKISNSEFYTLETTEYACEASYILLEFAKTSMFLWMLNEGLYLHNQIAVFHERLNLTIFNMIGWGLSILLVLVWGGLTSHAFFNFVCWSGYNLSGLFWVLEGPRLAVILLNLLFLLNIIRVLVTKLRESYSTEAQQVREAVKAAIFLLPLLGITNVIQMLHSPVDKSIVQFAIWSYVTTFLSSFQGFFCALIYCFLNGEVQLSLMRSFKTQKRASRGVNCEIILGPVRHHELANPVQDSVAKPEKQNPGGKVMRNRKLVDIMASRKKLFFEKSSDGHVDIEQIEIPLEYLSLSGTNKAVTSRAATGLPISSKDFQITVSQVCHQTSIQSKSASTMTSANGGNNDDDMSQAQEKTVTVSVQMDTSHIPPTTDKNKIN